MTSPGKVWYIAFKLGVDFSTCNKVFSPRNYRNQIIAWLFLRALEQSPCLQKKPTNRKDHKWR